MLDINTGALLGQLTARGNTDPLDWELPPVALLLRDLFVAFWTLTNQIRPASNTSSQNVDCPRLGSTKLVLRRAQP
jgi:hypothetical protein